MPRLLLTEPAPIVDRPMASPDSFGAGTARAMQQTGEVTQALGQVFAAYGESQQRAAAVRYEQDLAAEADQISLDPDIERRGEKFEAAQRRIFGRHRPGFGARGIFEERADLVTREMRTRLSSRMANDAIAEARANTGMQLDFLTQRAANAESPAEVESSLSEMALELEESNLYYTPAEKEELTRRALGQTLRSMAVSNPGMAEHYFEQLGDGLAPDDARAIQTAIGTESTAIEAQAIADEAIDTLGRGANITALLDYARRNSSGDVRTEAEGRLRMLHGANETARGDRERSKAKAAFAEIEALSAEGNAEPATITAARDDLRKRVAYDDDFDAGTAKSILDYFDAQTARKPIETDAAKWDELWTLRADDPAAFLKVNLPALRGKLSREDYNELEGEQDALRKGDKPAANPIADGDLGFLNDTISAAGITDAGTKAEIRLGFRRAVRAQQDAKGEPLERAEKERIAKGLLREVRVPGIAGMSFLVFGESKPIGQLTAEDGAALVENPDPKILSAALDSLRRRGVDDPDPELVDATVRGLLHRMGVPGVE